MAYTMLKLYLTAFVSENSFHLNGDYRRMGLSIHTYKPMTLEGGFGAAAVILEMLLQSWNKTIRVFPVYLILGATHTSIILEPRELFSLHQSSRRGK